jgi:transcriptional regulator with XRE-family HTH domain
MTLLERLRADRGLAQFEVETATGVNHRTLVKYEQARVSKVNFGRLLLLAKFYDVPASTLLDDIRRVHAERERLEQIQITADHERITQGLPDAA